MMISELPVLKADGALINARSVNRYAHHIVPTMTVTFSPILAFRRPMGPGPCNCATAAATVGGPAALRFSACGCWTYSKMPDMGSLHRRRSRGTVEVPSGVRPLG